MDQSWICGNLGLMESESAWFWWLMVPGSAVGFFVSFARVF